MGSKICLGMSPCNVCFAFSGESLHLDSQQPEDSGTCFLVVGAHLEDHPSKRGLTITMVISHLLTGMTLQAESMI